MISHKIFKSKLHTKPFNYIHIEKLFDDKTVAKLIKKFPEDKYFKKKKDITKYETKRKFLVLHDLYEDYWFKSKFWEKFIKKNLYYDYKNALLEKFSSFSRKPFPEELNFLNIRIELSIDEIGYKLDAHTDEPSRLITSLIYLNEKKTVQKKIGFNILKNKKNLSNYTGKHLDEKNFRKVNTIPFGRGNMLAFLRSNNSYHSVSKNNIYERKSIQIAIYYKNKS